MFEQFLLRIKLLYHIIGLYEKYKNGKKKIKARLVACSFQRDANNLKDSPTCNRECLQIVIFSFSYNTFNVQGAIIYWYNSRISARGSFSKRIIPASTSWCVFKTLVCHLKKCIYRCTLILVWKHQRNNITVGGYS